MRDIWNLLVARNADLVLAGHAHSYERFAPLDGDGQPVATGTREIVAGTGGNGHHTFGPPIAGSEVRDDTTYGVLKVTLRPGAYDWEFVPVAGATFTDSGTTDCH
jgi:hypothetical protein